MTNNPCYYLGRLLDAPHPSTIFVYITFIVALTADVPRSWVSLALLMSLEYHIIALFGSNMGRIMLFLCGCHVVLDSADHRPCCTLQLTLNVTRRAVRLEAVDQRGIYAC